MMVEHAAEVAAIDGVDVLFVGPTDLSHSLGVPGDFAHPTYLGALRAVVAGAQSAGKSAGILLRKLDDLERHVELGFRFIGIGSDLGSSSPTVRLGRRRSGANAEELTGRGVPARPSEPIDSAP